MVISEAGDRGRLELALELQLGENGRPVLEEGDKGRLIGDKGRLVGDKGRLVGDKGRLVGEKGRPAVEEGEKARLEALEVGEKLESKMRLDRGERWPLRLCRGDEIDTVRGEVHFRREGRVL